MSQVKYWFLDWEFEPKQDSLKNLATKEQIKLEPQSSALLLLFVSEPERIFSKQELNQLLWPNTVVEENSVYQLLTKLRRALKDSARSAQIIKTFPKKGYQFVAELKSEPLPEFIVDNKRPVSPDSKFSTPGGFSVLLVLAIVLVVVKVWQTTSETGGIRIKSKEVTMELGLESWPLINPVNGGLLYIKDEHQILLQEVDGNGISSELFYSSFPLSQATWSLDGSKLAVWRQNNEECELLVLDAQGNLVKQFPQSNCIAGHKIIWQNNKTLLALLNQEGNRNLITLNLASDQVSSLQLPLLPGEWIKTMTLAWQNKVLFAVHDEKYNSKIVDESGKDLFKFPYPIKLMAFSGHQESLIVNDETKHQGLVTIDREGRLSRFAETANGVFTSVAVAKRGDIYVAVETWQVNILDNNGRPLHSSTSVDYLPVTNEAGETAFMSRREGRCQVYLFSEGKVSRLSDYDNYDSVSFVRWSPNLNKILINRDNKAYIYDRARKVNNFKLDSANLPLALDWISDDEIYSYDGMKLSYYQVRADKKRDKRAEIKLTASNVYYQAETEIWWVFNAQGLYTAQGKFLEPSKLSLVVPLESGQISRLTNIRMSGDALYWQSHYKGMDRIWKFSVNNIHDIKLVKQGRFVWNYDVDLQGKINVAVKENIEGNIRLYQVY